MKTILSHHAFACGCRAVDVNLGDISPVELANILKAARNMKGESIAMAAGDKELASLKYKQLGSTSWEDVKRQLGVGPGEVVVAAVQAPEIFKLKNGNSLYADDRVFFIYNPKTGQIKPRGFSPHTDAYSSNQAEGENVEEAQKAAQQFAVSKLRALYKAEALRQKLASAGISASVRLVEDENGGEYVLDADADTEEQIEAVRAVYDEENS